MKHTFNLNKCPKCYDNIHTAEQASKFLDKNLNIDDSSMCQCENHIHTAKQASKFLDKNLNIDGCSMCQCENHKG